MRTRQTLSPAAILALLVCLAAATADARAQVTTQSPLSAPTGYVNDYAQVMDEATEARLEAILTNLKERADIEYAVVTVRTTGGRPIFDYTIDVARGWGIGAKEGERKGMVTLVAVEDRKYQTQVSRHLEGDLPDGLIGDIQRRTLVDPFRAGDYNRGISNAVQTFVATLAEKRGFSVEGIDQSYAYRPQQGRERTPRRTRPSGGGLGLGTYCVLGFIVLIVLSMLSRGGKGRGGFGGGGGCLNALLLANLFSNLGGGRGSSGWGGGGSSGWGGGGGGGGGFGGFGGGGDFGGGGAGGDW